jgi:hypothetical protein
METSPEQSIMLAVAALYIAITEAITETFGRDIELPVNRLLNEMKPHLPADAADLCDYLLEFASPRAASPPPMFDWLDGLNTGATSH